MATRNEVEELDLTWFHEAGHAVAGHLTGRRILEINITWEVAALGVCRFAPLRRSGRITERWRRDMIIRCLGGPVAESVHEGKTAETLAAFEHRRPETGRRQQQGDTYTSDIAAARAALNPWSQETARDFVYPLSTEEGAAYLEWLWVRTRSLLVQHWPAVEAIADELGWGDPIPGRRAHAIIREAMTKPPETQKGDR